MAPQGIIIRKAMLADAQKMSEIERSFSKSPWSESAFVSGLQSPSGAHFIAVDAFGTICAFIIGVIIFDELHIHNIATCAEFRRNGIATRLIGASIEQALECDVTRVFLEVRSKNTAAISLYEKLGFVSQFIRKKYYGDDGDDALNMIKNIGLGIKKIKPI